jgi:hypothetical protein
LREDGPKPLMKNKVLERMIKDNIRGLDPDSAMKEIERLTIINRQLGYSLPEKYRIQKLIHPVDGRKDLNNPVLNISESINRLGDRLLPKAGNLPLEFRVYQFLADLSQKQNQAGFKSDEILVVDVRKNVYSVFPDHDSFKQELQASDKDIENFTKRIFVNNKIIVSYLDPSKIDELNKLNNFSNAVDTIPNLRESLFGVPDSRLEELRKTTKISLDIRDILEEILDNQKASNVLEKEILDMREKTDDEKDKEIFTILSKNVKEKKVDEFFSNSKKLSDEEEEDLKESVNDLSNIIKEEKKEKVEKEEPEKVDKDVLRIMGAFKTIDIKNRNVKARYNFILARVLTLTGFNKIDKYVETFKDDILQIGLDDVKNFKLPLKSNLTGRVGTKGEKALLMNLLNKAIVLALFGLEIK